MKKRLLPRPKPNASPRKRKRPLQPKPNVSPRRRQRQPKQLLPPHRRKRRRRMPKRSKISFGRAVPRKSVKTS